MQIQVRRVNATKALLVGVQDGMNGKVRSGPIRQVASHISGNRRTPSLPNVLLETLNEGIERDPAARTIAQVFVHRDPGIQRQGELPGE
jgi:hypothetical protein